MMVKELSRQAYDTYMSDIIDHMGHREVNKGSPNSTRYMLIFARERRCLMLPV